MTHAGFTKHELAEYYVDNLKFDKVKELYPDRILYANNEHRLIIIPKLKSFSPLKRIMEYSNTILAMSYKPNTFVIIKHRGHEKFCVDILEKLLDITVTYDIASRCIKVDSSEGLTMMRLNGIL